jgi:ankyrin repeat protein
MSSPDAGPIHKALMKNDLREVIQAVAQGAHIDALDREGRTPLFYAVMDADLMIAAELIRHGADVNAQDRRQKSPLHFAVSTHQPEIAEPLLKSGANVDAQDVHGNTPLCDAVFESKGRGEIIKLLLARGADKTLKNKHGVSPEDLAKSIGNYDISPFLEK